MAIIKKVYTHMVQKVKNGVICCHIGVKSQRNDIRTADEVDFEISALFLCCCESICYCYCILYYCCFCKKQEEHFIFWLDDKGNLYKKSAKDY
ncbi:hypothetical protein AGMMS49532_07950 [Endomicrobiia bacterium]|nr:hypothetical protein AGMMS49532_07950 [Endomicrobiia bacterium]